MVGGANGEPGWGSFGLAGSRDAHPARAIRFGRIIMRVVIREKRTAPHLIARRTVQ